MRALEITKTEKPQKVSKEVIEKLKEMQMYNRVKFMKNELIYCPKESKEISPLNCMVCSHFKRRVKGKIYCDY